MLPLLDSYGNKVSLNGLSEDQEWVRTHRHLLERYLHHVNKFQEGMLQYLSPFHQKHHLKLASETWREIMEGTENSYPNTPPRFGFLHVLMALEHLFHGPPLPCGDRSSSDCGGDLLMDPSQLLREARKAMHVMNERECMLLNAVEMWLQGDMDQAIDVHRTIAHDHPQDMVNLFVVYNHYIVHYDMVQLEQLLRNSVMNMPDFNEWPFRHYVFAMMCFVMEQRFDMLEAERFGMLAMQGDYTNPKNIQGGSLKLQESLHRIYPWTHHSMCHVFHSTGRLREGVEYMERHSVDWVHCQGDFLDHHNWWHLALMYLELDELVRVREIYDSRVWLSKIDKTEQWAERKMSSEYVAAWRNDLTVLSDAIGLLIRMDLKHNIGHADLAGSGNDPWLEEQWKQVTEIVKLKWELKQHISPFFDIHFVYALARSGQFPCRDILLGQVEMFVHVTDKHMSEHMRHLWLDVFIPLARAVFGYVVHDFKGAYADFQRLFQSGDQPDRVKFHTEDQRNSAMYTTMQRHTCLIGGSHAQREFLELIYADLLVRLEKWGELKPLVQKRVKLFSQRPVSTTSTLLRLAAQN